MFRPAPTKTPPSPRLTLLPLLPDTPRAMSHAASFADLHFSSFIPGEMFQSLYSEVEKQEYVDRGIRRFQRVVERTHEDGTVLIVAMIEDDVVGGAYWSYPQKSKEYTEEVEESSAQIPVREFPPGTNLALATEYFNLLDTYEANGSLPPHYGLFAPNPVFAAEE